MNMNLYGITEKYIEYAKEYDEKYKIGRIISQEKGLYRMICEDGEKLAEI